MWKQYGRETHEVYEMKKTEMRTSFILSQTKLLDGEAGICLERSHMEIHETENAHRRTLFLNNPNLSFLRALQCDVARSLPICSYLLIQRKFIERYVNVIQIQHVDMIRLGTI
jgi:hypothetical protein